MGQARLRGDGIWACDECGFVYDLSPERLREYLARVPGEVAAVAEALPGDGLDSPVGPGLWSPRYYLAHLADWAGIVATRVDGAVGDPAFVVVGLDQDALAGEHDYAGWSVADSVERYRQAARSLRAALSDLPWSVWERPVAHYELGEVPLAKLAQDVAHETRHHLMDVGGH